MWLAGEGCTVEGLGIVSSIEARRREHRHEHERRIRRSAERACGHS